MDKTQTCIKKNKAVFIVILIVIVAAIGLYLKGAYHNKEGAKRKTSTEAGMENIQKKSAKKNKDKAAQRQTETPANIPAEPMVSTGQAPATAQ